MRPNTSKLPTTLSLPLALLIGLAACGETETENSNSGAAADAGIEESDAMATTPDAAVERIALRNQEECAGGIFGIGPAPGEAGHLAATRLTPPSYPFSVESVRYEVPATQGACSQGVAHRVEVYVTSENTPAAQPIAIETINVPKSAGTTEDVWLEHELADAISLSEGEHLIVAVEMAGEPQTAAMCVYMCNPDGSELVDRNWWSNSDVTPYPWADTVTLFGFGNWRMEAAGTEGP